jgi:chemotaxis protein CheD
MKNIPIRRSDTEKIQVGDYYDNTNRYYDQVNEVTVVKVFSGDCYVTAEAGEMMVTILGSCIAACIRDPIAKVGGMNHFLLPGEDKNALESLRFGAFSMEQLINEILKLGGKKERLEVKIFGGANVIKSSALIGTKNIEFVKGFLKDESLKISVEDVGEDMPRRVHYYPDSGRVMMRKLRRKEDKKIVDEELEYEHQLEKEIKMKKKVELF